MSSPLLRIWLVVVAIAVGVQLGAFPLLDADEGRNAEVAREMAATNDYVMPRLDGLPYLDKPVVYFAAEAAVMEVVGPTAFAARLPAYLFTLATAAVVFFFAKRVWGGDTPWIAAIVFLSMPLTISFARTVIFDSALTFFCVAALAAFYFAIEGSSQLAARSSQETLPAPNARRRWAVLAWAAMGLAMITKGPVTFVLVLFVVIPYAWKRKALRVVFPILGIVIFAAIIAPWVWGVSQVVPEFLHYVLVTETAARMATKALKRTGPPWYFIPYLFAGALPWSIAAIFNWRSFRKRENAMLFLLLAIAIPFVFFSLNQSKRPQYILPLMAPLALVIARLWDELRTRATAMIIAILGVLLLIAPLFLRYAKMKPEIAGAAPATAIALGIAFTLGGAVALLSKRRDLTLAALSLPMIAIPLVTTPLMLGIAERRSAKSFVEELRPRLTAQTQVIGVEAFTGSLAFYLQRPITVVTEDASELTSNYLIRRYEKFTRDPASPLKPLPYFERSLGACCPMYILRNDDAKRRALLESRGFGRVAEGAHLVAYVKRQ